MATTLRPGTNERFAQWWQLRSQKERISLAIAAGIVAIALAWVALWRPLTSDIARLSQQVATQRVALAEAQRQANDIANLSSKAAVPAPRDARADVEAALNRQGLKPTAIDRIDNDRLRVSFDAVSFDALTELFDRLQRDARLRAVDATITARVEPGQVRAELILAP